MTCTSCGHENAAGSVFCMRCGAPLQQSFGGAPATSAPVYGTPPEAATGYGAPTVPGQYAGFWIRFLAYLIDSLVMTVVFFILLVPIVIVIGIASATGSMATGDFDLGPLEGPLTALYYVGSISIQWLYEAFMLASSKQATLGRMALGLTVTDLEGNRISFGRATGRFFAKIVSGLILMIGYLMQPFTAKKQALHDIMAGTLVVKR